MSPHQARHALLPAACCLLLAACDTDLPPGSESFTVGHTLVRTDSALDVVGVVYRLADTATVPPRGAVRHWLQQLTLALDDPAIQAARAPGLMPVSLILETYVQPDRPDTACGWIAPGEQRCFTGNDAVRRQVRDFLAAAPSFQPRTVGLEGLSREERRRDLADVYVALTKGKSLDSAVMAYSGYHDLRFDVTLARTLTTGNTTAALDPARPFGPSPRIFLTPDHVYNSRSYRSPNYIWLALSHQMVHEVVRRVFVQHPELLRHGFPLRDAVAPEMNRIGYTGLFWDEAFGEQLARAVTIRVLALSSPSITWAARSDALNAGMTLVPWLEDALMRYEQARERYPTLGDFADRLALALDSVPTDACQASESPGVALIGVARHRAVVGWMADRSPFRARRLLIGDTVLAIDGDSASAAGLLTPTRQVNLAWARHLPFELAMLDIRRAGHDYVVQGPIRYVPRQQVRIASQARRIASDTLPICRWVTRARRR
jgi:hypothetical protein